jgi:N-acetylmuramoyl-L-alanine amidase
MKRLIKNIIIHCAATPNGQVFKAADIDAMHKARGFNRSSQAIRAFNQNLKHIGYHMIIEVDGTIALGRALEEIGAHVQGANGDSIGICMIGTDEFADVQYASLKQSLITVACKISGKSYTTIAQAFKAFETMGIQVKGHRDYSPDKNGDGVISRNEWLKICPGFDVAKFIKDLV